MIALDVFTCGQTDPNDVLSYIREEIDLGDVSIRQVPRFVDGVELERDWESPVATLM
jgi:S-adenosylmethionine/arginine decarboxylase-like enzyme